VRADQENWDRTAHARAVAIGEVVDQQERVHRAIADDRGTK
jgi:hypothetical protein